MNMGSYRITVQKLLRKGIYGLFVTDRYELIIL